MYVVSCICMHYGCVELASMMVVAGIDDLTTPPPFPYHSLFTILSWNI